MVPDSDASGSKPRLAQTSPAEAPASSFSMSSASPGEAPSGELLLVLTTVDSRDQADSIARTLVDERLAACVNILDDCKSVYRWQGTVEQAQETVLLIKTTRERYPRFEQRLLALHPYDLPEIVALAPEAVLPAYARWVVGETGETPA